LYFDQIGDISRAAGNVSPDEGITLPSTARTTLSNIFAPLVVKEQKKQKGPMRLGLKYHNNHAL